MTCDYCGKGLAAHALHDAAAWCVFEASAIRFPGPFWELVNGERYQRFGRVLVERLCVVFPPQDIADLEQYLAVEDVMEFADGFGGQDSLF